MLRKSLAFVVVALLLAAVKEETDTLTDLFKKALGNDKLTVKVEKLKNENLASIITLSEEGRRMQDMMKMYAMGGMGGMDPNMFAADQTLTLNANHALVKYIFEHKDSENVPTLCLLPGSTKRRPCETGYCGRANLFCYPDPTAGAG